jgi:hypothetical protein
MYETKAALRLVSVSAGGGGEDHDYAMINKRLEAYL